MLGASVWGENSAFEYGGEDEVRTGFKLDRAWLKSHGVTHGTTAKDWVGAGGLTAKDLTPYFGPGLLPHAQKLWIDELVVSRERIGPLDP